jgi:hypothetical protein
MCDYGGMSESFGMKMRTSYGPSKSQSRAKREWDDGRASSSPFSNFIEIDIGPCRLANALGGGIATGRVII